jgi:LemA protein
VAPSIHQANFALEAGRVMTLLLIAAGAGLLLLLWAVLTYDALVRARNRVDEAWSGVDVQLKRRRDLVPNLAHAIDTYAARERGVLQEMTEARTDAMGATSRVWRERCERRLTGALLAVIVAAERYPDLRASSGFQQLQRELAEIEDDIVGARRIFNSNVQRYNDLVQMFPASLIASFGPFTPRQYFDVETSAERASPVTRPEGSRLRAGGVAAA